MLRSSQVLSFPSLDIIMCSFFFNLFFTTFAFNFYIAFAFNLIAFACNIFYFLLFIPDIVSVVSPCKLKLVFHVYIHLSQGTCL